MDSFQRNFSTILAPNQNACLSVKRQRGKSTCVDASKENELVRNDG